MRNVGVLLAVIWFSATAAFAIDGANVEWLTPVNIAGTDWKSFELITANDSVTGLAGGGNYSWGGRTNFDGAGAFQLDGNTIRVFVNHEAAPASISYIDLDRAKLQSWAVNQATGATWAGTGKVVTGIGNAWSTIVGDTSLSRFCSGNLWEPDTFGAGRGFADRVYLTGEEVAGGQFYALEPATQTLRQVPDLGSGAWESATPIDTGRSDTIAILLNEDAGSGPTGTSPLRLYVGQKNPAGNFLQRNGLVGGKTYYWDPDGSSSTDGTIDGPVFDTDADPFTDASGRSVAGTWVSALAGAARFSKLEDTHTNMRSADAKFGREAVFACQDEGLFHVELQNLSFVAGDLSPNQKSVVRLLLQAAFDQDPNGDLAGFDNVAWSPDGLVYINEDGSSGEVWQLDPDNAALSAVNILDPTTSISRETSGIFDLSEVAGFAPGSVFITDVHSSTLANNQLVLIVSPTAVLVPEPAVALGAIAYVAIVPRSGRRRACGARARMK